MKCTKFAIAIFVSLALHGCNKYPKEASHLELFYQQPATEWMEALPIGNGRIGAMIYGGIGTERIALNESSMWSGEPDDNQEMPFGKEKLNQLRYLFFNGDIIKGNQIAGESLHGTPHSFGTHLPIGEIQLHFSHSSDKVTNYRRSLNIEQALCKIDYQINDTIFTREYFSTNPSDVIVMHLHTNKPKGVSFTLGMDLLRESDIKTLNNQIIFKGQALQPMHGKGGVLFEGRVALQIHGGKIKNTSHSIIVEQADSVTLISDVRTNYKNNDYSQLCQETITKAQAQDFNKLKTSHIIDFSSLFNRVSIQLGEDSLNYLPTDTRWQQVRNGQTDTGLDALLFQYARYLLIASSRENSPLPIALQGFFNDNLACNMGWTNDYHLDINTQQNYWIANVGNLAECNSPLFSFLKDLSVHGSQTARTVYGCKGWTAHTTANIWGYTAPSSSIAWGLFPTAGSWLASHLWTQYEYTQDKTFLKETAYPILKGNAEFLLDYMIKDPRNGYLVTGPSISPENSFLYQGENLCASMMPTCDRILVYEIFQACIESAQILNIDQDFRKQLKTAINQLPPIRQRKDGAICEWMEDYEEAQPNHRHTTHLLGFYPYHQITLDKTPELAQGVRKTIENRLAAEGWEDTEWSRANIICIYARLKDAIQAYNSLQTFKNKLTRENLFSISPAGIAGAPYDIYAFDGNAATAAGIAEMLVQSHEGYTEFLPCLPSQWKDGSFSGLCIRGGGEVSAKWRNSVLTNATLKAICNNSFQIKLPKGKTYKIRLNGKELESPHTEILTINMNKGDILELKK